MYEINEALETIKNIHAVTVNITEKIIDAEARITAGTLTDDDGSFGSFLYEKQKELALVNAQLQESEGAILEQIANHEPSVVVP